MSGVEDPEVGRDCRLSLLAVVGGVASTGAGRSATRMRGLKKLDAVGSGVDGSASGGSTERNFRLKDMVGTAGTGAVVTLIVGTEKSM